MQAPALPAIATGFVRKLYRILDQESALVIAWDADGASFVLLDNEALETQVLPRYFRGRLNAFRQQLKEHSFALVPAERGQERYCHPFFRRGCPEELNRIIHTPLPRKRPPRKKRKQPEPITASDVKVVKSNSDSGIHRVTQPEFKHASVDPLALAGNPLFAQDESLSGFVQGLKEENLSIQQMDLTPCLMSEKEETMPDDVMDALLSLLSTSLSTDGRDATAAALVTSGGNSTSSTGSANIFAEGRSPVILPQLPPGIVENGQFSDETLHNLMHWVSANRTSTL